MTTTLRIKEHEKVAVPGTSFVLEVPYVAHRIASAAGDRFPRSMVTATFVLFDGSRRVYEAHHVVGRSFRHETLRFTFVDFIVDEVVVDVSRAGA